MATGGDCLAKRFVNLHTAEDTGPEAFATAVQRWPKEVWRLDAR